MAFLGAEAILLKFSEETATCSAPPSGLFFPYRARWRDAVHRIRQISGLPDILSRKRGIALRINEAYEHESILSRSPQPEDACPPVSGCNKISTQCVDVTAPMTLTPTASIGTVNISCQGSPCVTCVTDPAGTSCTVTLTQQICVSVPVRYGVTMAAGEPTIACAAGSPACSCGA